MDLGTAGGRTACATGPIATSNSATGRSGRLGLLPSTAAAAGFNPRTLELAATLMRDNPARAGRRWCRPRCAAAHRRLHYTLEPGVYGEHTADEFWFDRKEGFCEHIASAFVVLMRAMGIPRASSPATRAASSTRGRLLGGAAKRRACLDRSLAGGRGWVRVDPTSAVAPAAPAPSSAWRRRAACWPRHGDGHPNLAARCAPPGRR
jgi:transglutaminase-like putative cysteine protease